MIQGIFAIVSTETELKGEDNIILTFIYYLISAFWLSSLIISPLYKKQVVQICPVFINKFYKIYL